MSKGSKPLPPGWKAIVKVRQQGRSAGRKDFYFFSPDNVKIRSKVQLQFYLKDTKSKYTIDDFEIPSSAPKKAKQTPVIKKNKASNKIVQARIAKKSLNSKDSAKKISPKSVAKDAKSSASSRSNSVSKSASSSKSKSPGKKQGKPVLKKTKPPIEEDDESPEEDESPVIGDRKAPVKKNVKQSVLKGKKSPAKVKGNPVKVNRQVMDKDEPTVKGKDDKPSKIVLRVFSPAKTAKKISKQAFKSAQKSVSKSPRKVSGNDIESVPETTLVNSRASRMKAKDRLSTKASGKSNPITTISPGAKATRGRPSLMDNKKEPVSVPKKSASNNASKKSNVNKK